MFKRISRRVEHFLFKKLGSNYKVKMLRKWGTKIGENCYIACSSFSTEPYLIEIGDHVAISSSSQLITHDGGVWVFELENPKLDLFGKIKIGNNTFIGEGCIILANTTIGNNCVIGAGTIVRGNIPDNSVVIGNPGKVIMSTNVYKLFVEKSPFQLNTKGLSSKMKKKIILDRMSEH